MKNRINPQLLRLHAIIDMSTTTASSRLLSACRGNHRCNGALMRTTRTNNTSTSASGMKPTVSEVFEKVKSLIGVSEQIAITAIVPSRRLRQVTPRGCRWLVRSRTGSAEGARAIGGKCSTGFQPVHLFVHNRVLRHIDPEHDSRPHVIARLAIEADVAGLPAAK